LRRLLAILFSAIVLFNFYGYRLMISYLQDQLEDKLQSRLDKDQYSDDELISVKLALNMPYYSSTVSYERESGSVNVNGVYYSYVKRRVYKDTLELLCIPNEGKTALQSVKDDLLKQSVDGPVTHQSKKPVSVLKITLPEYFQEYTQSVLSPLKKVHTLYGTHAGQLLPDAHSLRQERPPQVHLFNS